MSDLPEITQCISGENRGKRGEENSAEEERVIEGKAGRKLVSKDRKRARKKKQRGGDKRCVTKRKI